MRHKTQETVPLSSALWDLLFLGNEARFQQGNLLHFPALCSYYYSAAKTGDFTEPVVISGTPVSISPGEVTLFRNVKTFFSINTSAITFWFLPVTFIKCFQLKLYEFLVTCYEPFLSLCSLVQTEQHFLWTSLELQWYYSVVFVVQSQL